MTQPIIELRGVKKAFGPVSVLRGVGLEVHPGKVTALVGDNGAGKSTLIKGLAGVQPYDEGEVLFDGEPAVLHTPRDAAHLGIEVVYQDLALCDNLDIVQNMFLGRESVSNGVLLDELTMEERARTTLASLSVRTVKSVRQSVSSLSGGQRQTVAIAKAVLAASETSRFDLVYANRSAMDVMFAEEIGDLKDKYPARFTVHHVLSREQRVSPLLSGRIDEDKLTTLLDRVIDVEGTDEWFLCGPFELVQLTRETLAARGVSEDDVRFELFTTGLLRHRKKELERGISLVGPHRDELALLLGHMPVKGYASHGETWSMALALRLASYELLRGAGALMLVSHSLDEIRKQCTSALWIEQGVVRMQGGVDEVLAAYNAA